MPRNSSHIFLLHVLSLVRTKSHSQKIDVTETATYHVRENRISSYRRKERGQPTRRWHVHRDNDSYFFGRVWSSSGIRYALVHASIFLWRFAVLSPVTFAYISLVTSPAFLRIRAISFLLVLLLGSLLEGVPLFQPVDCKCFVPIRLFPGTTEDVCPLNVGLWFSVSATHWQRTILNGASDFRNGMVFGIKYIQFYKRSCLWIRFMWQ